LALMAESCHAIALPKRTGQRTNNLEIRHDYKRVFITKKPAL